MGRKRKITAILWTCPKCGWQWTPQCSEWELYCIGMFRTCPKCPAGYSRARISGAELSEIMGYDVDKEEQK